MPPVEPCRPCRTETVPLTPTNTRQTLTPRPNGYRVPHLLAQASVGPGFPHSLFPAPPLGDLTYIKSASLCLFWFRICLDPNRRNECRRSDLHPRDPQETGYGQPTGRVPVPQQRPLQVSQLIEAEQRLGALTLRVRCETGLPVARTSRWPKCSCLKSTSPRVGIGEPDRSTSRAT